MRGNDAGELVDGHFAAGDGTVSVCLGLLHRVHIVFILIVTFTLLLRSRE